MALLTTGKRFIRDLEATGALGLYVPLEGGFEGRYQRRLRNAGYPTLHLTAKGLGDLSAYLMGVHGVRPPHLGKKSVGHDAAVGNVYFVPPILGMHLEQLPSTAKGLALWLIEGYVLTQQELAYLAALPSLEPRLKVVVEMGGERVFTWKPLKSLVAAA